MSEIIKINSKIEFEQLNKIMALYKKNLYKDALFLAHYNRQKCLV